MIGAGGHARVVQDAADLSWASSDVRVVADQADVRSLLGHRIEMPLPDPSQIDTRSWRFHVAIGNNAVRQKIADSWLAAGIGYETIVHPSAVVSPHATLGDGVFLGPLAVVNAGAHIGKGAIVNSGAIVEHDCIIGDYTHVGPGVALGGGVRVGRRSWLGLNSAVRELIEIGDDVVLGAGAVAVRPLIDAGTYAGCPARRI